MRNATGESASAKTGSGGKTEKPATLADGQANARRKEAAAIKTHESAQSDDRERDANTSTTNETLDHTTQVWMSRYTHGLSPAALMAAWSDWATHIAGIVSEPGHPRRSYQISNRKDADLHIGPDAWDAQTPVQEGSWWIPWAEWLDGRSSIKTSPPQMGRKGQAPICDTPGTYVFQK